MAVVVFRGADPPSSFIKLYQANWLLSVESEDSDVLYSTDQGATWCVVSKDTGKIAIYNTLVFVEDTADLTIWQIAKGSEPTNVYL